MVNKRICTLSQLEDRDFYKTWMKEFKDEIIVFKDEKKIYVMSSICPHFGGPIIYNKKQKELSCHWHGLKFSLEGKCLNQKNFKPCLNHYEYKIT